MKKTGLCFYIFSAFFHLSKALDEINYCMCSGFDGLKAHEECFYTNVNKTGVSGRLDCDMEGFKTGKLKCDICCLFH